MKKLTKLSLLLVLTTVLTACSNAANTANSTKEGDVPALPTIISESEIATLTETGHISDFTNGSWTIQAYTTGTNPKQFTSSWSKSNYESKKASLTADEQAELDSWISQASWTKTDTSNVYFNFPFVKKLWSRTIDFDKVKDNPKAENAFQVTKMTFSDRSKITNALYSKLIHADNSYTWDGDIATTNWAYTNIQQWMLNSYFNPIVNNMENFNWKTNSTKTKFYAVDGDTKYYLIKK